MTHEKYSRRTILTTSAAALLAGCTGSNDSDSRKTPTPTAQPTATTTPEPQTQTETSDPTDQTVQEYFKPEEFQQMRQNWLYNASFQTLVNTLQNSQGLELLDGNGTGVFYPNSNVETNDFGHWNLQDYQNADNIQEILRYNNAAIRIYYDDIEGGPASIANTEFAATQERLVNELHPKLQIRTVPVSTSGYGDHGNHGVYHAYIKNIEEFESNEKWWWIDTTSNGLYPINESPDHTGNQDATKTNGRYNPYGQGYPPEQKIPVSQSDIKLIAQSGIIGLAAGGFAQPDHMEYDKIRLNDNLMTNMYEHARNNGDIEPILEVLEPAVYAQAQTGKMIEISGDTLDKAGIEWS